MSKLIFTTTLAVLGLGLIATNVEARGRGQCGVTYVAPAVAAAPVQTAAAQPQAPVQGYRAMSYQPAPQYFAPVYQGTQGGGGGGQDLWRYQKTDPRKYR
ncbi:hypothetical protein ETAA8_17330 [Anatilimnocola aggregata]|uniref:Uncharacterized protein n=1 Tax=Anatilimnocola aggregata TaxID=2528021 RepID=A0A517Y922_9BACT|nr:hypothetical protein [Anatilimnocola aggregata]QDU26652.1 hypothetical protein ETAA8_17330 [Anatilimnocola aggregata]